MAVNPEQGRSHLKRDPFAWTWTTTSTPSVMRKHNYYYIVGAFGLVLTGCLGSSERAGDRATAIEREIDENLDGIAYRMHSLRAADSASEDGAQESLEELRSHRDALRRELDRVIDSQEPVSDSVEASLRSQLEELAVRYETARLGQFENRNLFQRAVNARFEDLDRELALLEGEIFQEDLHDEFEPTLARLYGFRNDVALLVAKTSAASEAEFPRFKIELAAAVGRLDIMLANATRRVDRAFDRRHPVRSLSKLWL